MFDEKFWVGLAFIIFALLVYKPVSRLIKHIADERTQKVKEELERAVRLREEAQEILSNFQLKQREALEEAGNIVSQAKASVQYMLEKARMDLEELLNRRVQTAMKKISQYEMAIVQEMKDNALLLAIHTVQHILLEETDKNLRKEPLQHSLEEIKRKFH